MFILSIMFLLPIILINVGYKLQRLCYIFLLILDFEHSY